MSHKGALVCGGHHNDIPGVGVVKCLSAAASPLFVNAEEEKQVRVSACGNKLAHSPPATALSHDNAQYTTNYC